MGKICDDMTRLVGEIQSWDRSRDEFINQVKADVKQGAEETRMLISNFRNDISGAHSAWAKRNTAHSL